MNHDPRDTPAMRQYARFKKAHPDCMLLFRIGDFYEMFDQDAVNASKAVGLTLTQRSAGIPMAGIPYHQLEQYARKLINAGFRVAICDQLTPATPTKPADRAVTSVITPGNAPEREEQKPRRTAATSTPHTQGLLF